MAAPPAAPAVGVDVNAEAETMVAAADDDARFSSSSAPRRAGGRVRGPNPAAAIAQSALVLPPQLTPETGTEAAAPPAAATPW